MADENTVVEELSKEEKLARVHDPKVVYARANGGNDEITFDAYVDGKKIPVTTVNNNKMESHFTFPPATEKATAEEETTPEDGE
jgi:hypothetical protein